MSEIRRSFWWIMLGPLLGGALSLILLSLLNSPPNPTPTLKLNETAGSAGSDTSLSRAELLKSFFEAERLQLSARIEFLKNRLGSLKEEEIQTTLQDIKTTDPYIEELKKQRAIARTEAADAAAKLASSNTVLQSGEINSLPEGINSSFIQKMKEDYYALLRKEAALATHLGDRHPDLMEMRSEINKFKSQLSDELMDLISSSRYQQEASVAKERDLERAIDEAEQNKNRVPASQLIIKELEEDLLTRQKLYQSLLEKTEELGNTKELLSAAKKESGSLSTEIRTFVLSLMILSLGLLGGFGLSSLSFFWMGKMPSSTEEIISKPEEQREPGGHVRTILPYIGASSFISKGIASLSAKRDRFRFVISSLFSPNTSQELAYRRRISDLVQSVCLSAELKKSYITAVTSLKKGCGASSVSLALATCAAKEEKKILLIDASSRGHALSKYFKIIPDPELTVVLDRSEDLLRMTIHDREKNLFFLPIALADIPSLRPSQLRRLSHGLKDLASSFDVVFLDTGCLLEDEAAGTFVEIADEIIGVGSPEALSSEKKAEIDAILRGKFKPYSVVENRSL